MTRIVKKGATDVSVHLYIVDSTDGTPETAVAYNTSGIDLWYCRNGAVKTSINEASLSALTDAHADGGFLAVGNGVYRLDVPDAAFESGADFVTIGGTVTGMVVMPVTVQLVAVDPQDSVRGGMAALPNAAANAVGGLAALVIAAGTAQAGGTSTQIILASATSIADSIINSARVTIISGTGAGQSRVITGWSSATDTATVDTAWVTNPDATSVYVIEPLGIVGLSAAQVAAAVLNAETASHTTSGTVGKAIGDINTKAASLTFTVAGAVDANIQRINDVAVTGNGATPKFGV